MEKDSRTQENETLDGLRPELLIACGLMGVLGNLAPLLTLVIGNLMVPEQGFFADTISALGDGELHYIMDTGFYLNAGGLLALSIGAAHYHLGRWDWSLGIFALAFLALTVTLIGIWDEFHTAADNPPGLSVHTKLTFALGPLFLVGPLLMIRGARRVWSGYGPLFIASALLWAVLATIFKLAPNDIDGLFEKLAVAATLLWVLPLSILMVRAGLRVRS